MTQTKPHQHRNGFPGNPRPAAQYKAGAAASPGPPSVPSSPSAPAGAMQNLRFRTASPASKAKAPRSRVPRSGDQPGLGPRGEDNGVGGRWRPLGPEPALPAPSPGPPGLTPLSMGPPVAPSRRRRAGSHRARSVFQTNPRPGASCPVDRRAGGRACRELQSSRPRRALRPGRDPDRHPAARPGRAVP